MAIRPDGTGLETLLELKEEGWISGGRVAPNGKRVAYNVLRPKKKQSELWLLGSDGKQDKIADDAVVCAWSADGKSVICYRGAYAKWSSFALDLETKKERPLAIPETDIVYDCSADGQTFAVVATNPGKVFKHPKLGTYPLRQIYTATEKELKRVDRSSDPMHDDMEPRFSPDGKHLAFERRRHEDGRVLHSLIVLDLAGKDTKEVVQYQRLGEGYQSYRSVGAPCWSPDGKHIVSAVGKSREVPSKRNKDELLFKDTVELLLISPGKGVVNRLDLEEVGVSLIGGIDWR